MAIQARRGNKAKFEPDRLQPGEIATPLDTDEAYVRTGSGALPLVTKGGKNDIFNLIYPVGSIYISTSSADPKTIFGGTWEAYGVGRVLVGVDPNDTDFNAAGKTDGEKKHTLTTGEVPSCEVAVSGSPLVFNGTSGGSAINLTSYSNSASDGAKVNSIGGGQAHNNMPPYITCYMWHRTA